MDDLQMAESLDPISQRHEEIVVSFLEAKHPLPLEAVKVIPNCVYVLTSI